MLAIACALPASPASAADMSKTLHVVAVGRRIGFDPQAISDSYSFDICRAIFESLYTYDYFARPVRMVPNTADGMPQISDGGRTYTVKVKPGIYFASDPAFKGKRRELTAEDYVYSDQADFRPEDTLVLAVCVRSPPGRARRGACPARARPAASTTTRKIEGLQTVDRYTLRVRFKDPNYTFAHWLADAALSAVAREVVEAHADASNRVMEHPVGTGPYRLKEWVRGQKIVLEANPDFRDADLSGAGRRQRAGRRGDREGQRREETADRRPHRDQRHRRGPAAAARVRQRPARLSASCRGRWPTTSSTKSRLRSDYAKRGITLHRQTEPSLSFVFFNMDDPVVGGYTPEKIALRRAMIMGYDRRAEIDVLRHGQAEPASQLVPPGLAGHDPTLRANDLYDPAGARALLDKFGYKDRDGDGYRETPDGKPLLITKANTPAAIDRVDNELWKKCMDAIGIRMVFFTQKWPELNKMSEAGQLQMWGLSWISNSPDGDAFASPLYSKNIGTSNDARFRLPAYDRAYEASLNLPDGPARTALFRSMSEAVLNYAPWMMDLNAYVSVLAQPWLKGYKQNPFLRNQWKYYDVDKRR